MAQRLNLALPMAQAWHDNRKNATHRPIKLLNLETSFDPETEMLLNQGIHGVDFSIYSQEFINSYCKYKKGEKVFIAEPWIQLFEDDSREFVYGADFEPQEAKSKMLHFQSPETMPEEAARSWAIITDIRVERLQDITYGDIEDEGYPNLPYEKEDTEKWSLSQWEALKLDELKWFASIWDSFYGDTPYAWDNNPYVEVDELKKINK